MLFAIHSRCHETHTSTLHRLHDAYEPDVMSRPRTTMLAIITFKLIITVTY